MPCCSRHLGLCYNNRPRPGPARGHNYLPGLFASPTTPAGATNHSTPRPRETRRYRKMPCPLKTCPQNHASDAERSLTLFANGARAKPRHLHSPFAPHATRMNFYATNAKWSTRPGKSLGEPTTKHSAIIQPPQDLYKKTVIASGKLLP